MATPTVGVIRGLVVTGAVLLLFSLGEGQRRVFGHQDGNYLLLAEILTLVAFARVALHLGSAPLIHHVSKTPIYSAWILLGVIVSAWLLFLGWFVHPDQIFQRAWDEEQSISESVIELQRRSAQVRPEKMERAVRILRGAELRRQATEIEPYESNGAWILVGSGGIMLLLFGALYLHSQSTALEVTPDSKEKL